MKLWSELRQSEREPFLWEARREIYPGLEPVCPEKEKAIPAKARELYYDAQRS